MEKRAENDKGESSEERTTLLRNAIDAFQNAPSPHTISAMEVVIWYVAISGRVEHYKRGEEHVFRIRRALTDDGISENLEGKPLNAYAVRDEFLKVKAWSEALEFLGSTGAFLPLGDTLTWSEFQRWQRIAYLVQEHTELAKAMQRGDRSGELSEVLKAITGIYPSSFFDFPREPESALEAKWRADPKTRSMIEKGEALYEQKRHASWNWFREPPAQACSIQWVPKRKEDEQAVWNNLQRGGAMIEYLLPQEALQPVLLIRPGTTIQAIAAAIYGDRIHGVEYRVCKVCKSLFKLGAHKDRKYCDRERCKNTAHQRNRRANAKSRRVESIGKKARKGR